MSGCSNRRLRNWSPSQDGQEVWSVQVRTCGLADPSDMLVIPQTLAEPCSLFSGARQAGVYWEICCITVPEFHNSKGARYRVTLSEEYRTKCGRRRRTNIIWRSQGNPGFTTLHNSPANIPTSTRIVQQKQKASHQLMRNKRWSQRGSNPRPSASLCHCFTNANAKRTRYHCAITPSKVCKTGALHGADSRGSTPVNGNLFWRMVELLRIKLSTGVNTYA